MQDSEPIGFGCFLCGNTFPPEELIISEFQDCEGHEEQFLICLNCAERTGAKHIDIITYDPDEDEYEDDEYLQGDPGVEESPRIRTEAKRSWLFAL